MEKIGFKINQEILLRLQNLLATNDLEHSKKALDSLVQYAEDRYAVLGNMLLNPNISEDERKDLIRKVIIAERKFRHMLDVPSICVQFAKDKNYSHEHAELLTIIGILHDLGRISEILNTDKDSVFKMKVDHSLLGAQYLTEENEMSKKCHLYDFVDSVLVERYGELIVKCIRYHGSLSIPAEFPTELGKSLIHDIRLIDKSSIMNSFLVEDIGTVIGIPATELAKTSISDATFDALTHQKPVDRKKDGELYTPNRQFMSHVGFIYDMSEFDYLTEDWVEKYLDIYNPEKSQDLVRKLIIKDSAKEYVDYIKRK